jgi:GxxExxY protein
MPIQRTLHIRSVNDDEFSMIDEAVMRCSYATQNKFGRMFDERIYENDLGARLRAEGFDVHTQIPVKVTYGSFEKTYLLDIVVNHMLYELKVVASLTQQHEAQALTYAMLQDIRRVKLINFGERKVRGKLLRNALIEPDRHQPKQRHSGWYAMTPQCTVLVGHLKDLIKDWGTHLDCRLYNEALVHRFGGESQCLHRMEMMSNNLKLGSHLLQIHSPGHAFVLTSFSSHQTEYRQHLEVLLEHVKLDGIQWINLNRSCLEITTIQKDI